MPTSTTTVYITRLMQCPDCKKSAHHTVPKELAREPVTCWDCDSAGKRVACVEVPVIRQAFAKEVYAVKLSEASMTTLIDYSRPVGWWCPVCTRIALTTDVGLRWCCSVTPHRGVIPRYLPIPEGQRPPAASEVEEAEVVTFTSLTTGRFRISGVDIEIGHDGNARGSWSDEGEFVLDPDTVVNFCAEQSARARIVTGATE